MQVNQRSKELEQILEKYSKLLKSKPVKFRDGLESIPRKQGVYIIYRATGTVLHVGRTYRRVKGMWGRILGHSRGRSSFMKNYKKISTSSLKECYVKFLIVKNDRIRALLELYTAGHLCPKYLGLHKSKQEKINSKV